MKQYQTVYLTVYAGVASLCWYVLEGLGQEKTLESVFGPLRKYFDLPLESYRSYAIPVVLFCLVLMFRMSDWISRAIIEKVPVISRSLRRLLNGRRDIEGDWPLVVVNMATRKPMYFGFLSIEFRNGQHYVHGDDWKTDGTHAHAFRSVQSMYRDYKLQYWYEQGQSLHQPNMRGYTEIFFFPKYEFAKRHAGKFLDPKHVSDIRFYAIRSRYRIFEHRIKTKQQKIAAARKFWSLLEPQIDVIHDRKIHTDFD